MVALVAAGAAARLAAQVEARCLAGIGYRASGECVGMHGRRGSRTRAADARGVGPSHDVGCRAFGVPIRELVRQIRELDRVGVSPLLIEAVTEAAEEIDAWDAATDGPGWRERAARESLSYAIRKRITPAPSGEQPCG